MQFHGVHVLFAPNPGNAGDSIIACAEYQMLDRLGINYSVIPLDISPSETQGQVIFYGGGGNLVAPYPNARNFISKHHEHAKRLVVLPHTIAGYSELISALGSNVDIVCREQTSHDYVSQFVTGANVHLMDDVALSLDVSSLLSPAKISESAWIIRTLRASKRAIRILHHGFKNSSQRKTLNAFRGDVEGTGRAVAFANFDVSQMLAADSMSALDSTIAARSFIGFINKFDIVRTDRLHVCIVSLLLKKEVHFFDNSYGKNRAVYEFSMINRHPNVIWNN